MAEEEQKKKKSGLPLFTFLFGNRNKLDVMQEEQIASPFRTVMRTFRRNKVSMGALIIFLIIVVILVIAPLFTPVNLSYSEPEQANLPPGGNYMQFPPEMANNPRDIDVGPTFGIGADENGDVHVWGTTKTFSMPELQEIPEGVTHVKKVAAGSDHVLALTEDGKLFAWGNKRLQQTKIPKEVEKLKNIKDIYASYQYSAVLTEDGKSYIFGNTLNLDYNNYHAFQGNLEKLALGSETIMAMTKDGKIAYLGLQNNSLSKVPEESNFVDIAGGARAFAGITADGQIKVWGNITTKGEDKIPENLSAKPIQISAGKYHFSALLEDGSLVTWGDNELKQSQIPVKLKKGTYMAVNSGYWQNYAVTAEGQLVAFGKANYLMGTDFLGRDVFNRILNGGRLTLSIGTVSVIISTVLGTILGGISGFFGGHVDMFIQRVGEIVNSLPFLPTVIILNSIIGNKLDPMQRIYLVMVVLGLLSWVQLMRLIRAQVLSLREQEYVTAARSMGIKETGIVFRHILPNVVSTIIVSATLNFAGSLLTESSLSFLGFGVQPPQPTWGNMLHGANDSTIIQNYWWCWVFPAVILSICVICINLIGTGLDDAIDPKSQER